MALNAIEEIDHAVWVWLGGQRRLILEEIYALLEKVNDEDMPTFFTENLIMRIGSKASQTRKLRADLKGIATGLELAFDALEPLASLRDTEVPIRPVVIAGAMIKGCKRLQGVIGRQEQGDVNLDPTKISKKSGFKLQFWRDRGDWPNELDMERMGNAAQARAKPNVQPATPSS